MHQRLVLFLIGFLSVTAYGAPHSATDWQLVSDDDGIQVFSRKVEGSDVVAFKGQAEIDAPVSKVVSVLSDTAHKKDWVAKLVEARDLKISSPFERVEYNHTASGFPFVSDRDFVFRAWVELDRANHQFVIHLKSVADPNAPQSDGLVRGEITEGAYFLAPIDDGRRTKLVLEIQADPKGSIPKFLVNSFQKHWPRKTIQGIQRQVIRGDLADNPAITEAMRRL